MPRGDGTGPTGQGPVGGGGGGRGRGGGFGGGGGGRRGGGPGRGRAGNCVCAKCGKVIAHQRGAPCTQIRCPDCGAMMVRQR